ncbi:DEAD/DEAH box helicase family protein [Clostridium sp. 1001271B_151109_B4]|uniref:DEAD/DEAH box helicase family protein n=1 Tax=Clostridium sp. 1001271B_151109_B4 TaxID=2787148 RepID=UPI0018AB217C|nr:DEAD/DEAH box helicase family protein [Clostridium sp. 1001271B_151109_B4]
MKRKYVSDVIGKEKVEELIKGNNYLIGSEMGSGKNYWVRNILLPYAFDNNMKVLILSSRTAIKEQQYNYLEEYEQFCIRNFKAGTFEIMSYQKFENVLRSKDKKLSWCSLGEINYIVCDEAHYFIKDTSMNNKTVLSFDWLNNNHNIVKIFMTATYEALDYLPFLNKLEVLKDADYNNNNVKDFYRYESQDTVTPIIQQEVNKGKKVLIINNKKHELDMWQDTISGQVENLISNNKDNSKEFKSIVKHQKFNSDVLNTTSLICEGTEIFDSTVETIIINGVSDLEKFVQTTARIRSNKVNVFYKRITPRAIEAKLRGLEKQLFYYDEFVRLGEINFVKKYGLDIIDKSMKSLYLDTIVNPFTGEEMITLRTHTTNLGRLEYEFDLYQDIRAYGFENRVLKKYFPGVSWYDLEQLKREEYIKLDIIDSYKDKKIFKDEQEIFINVISNKFGLTRKDGSKKLGLKTINSFFEDNNINYKIDSKRIKRDGKLHTVWILEEVA